MEAENEAENSGKRLTERHSAYDPFSFPWQGEFNLEMQRGGEKKDIAAGIQ
jgi:hypothetical protein